MISLRLGHASEHGGVAIPGIFVVGQPRVSALLSLGAAIPTETPIWLLGGNFAEGELSLVYELLGDGSAGGFF